MTVLRGALLVDGTGAPPRPANVVIDADRIAAVEARTRFRQMATSLTLP